MSQDYQIKPVKVKGFADANGVYLNESGAWVGEIDDTGVQPYADEDGDFIPAPENWRDLIVKAL